MLSSQAEHLLYNPEWSDEGEDEEVEKGANEDIQSVYSEASLQQELTRVLHTSESQESIDAWDDDQWGQFSQISETWDAMVDHHGIMLSEDGLTVLSGTLNSRQPVQLSRPSSSETEDSSDETDSEWGFLETSTASTPRNEDTLAAELVGSHWTTWGSRDTTDTSVPLDGVNALLPTSPGPILAKGRKWSSGVLEAETPTERLSSQVITLLIRNVAAFLFGIYIYCGPMCVAICSNAGSECLSAQLDRRKAADTSGAGRPEPQNQDSGEEE